MSFSLWDDATTGTQVWGPEAQGSVQVTDGFFAVVLGETSPIDASVLQTTMYLEIAVGGETLDPRQQLGAVAFALSASQAESVPWSGVTGEPSYTTRWPTWSEVTGKPGTFTPSSHTHAWSDVTGEPSYTTRWPSWGEVTGKPSTFAPSSHTHGSGDIDAYADLSASGRLNNNSDSDLLTRLQADARYEIPAGGIIMWSGSIGSIPTGWALCDGSNGTPDLTNRFVVGAGDEYSVDDVGGSDAITLTVAELPAHHHSVDPPGTSTGPAGAHTHSYMRSAGGGSQAHYLATWDSTDPFQWETGKIGSVGDHTHSVNIAAFNSADTGSGQGHENRPPYYALAYIMKLP
jgi:microcystin-dependent protein